MHRIRIADLPLLLLGLALVVDIIIYHSINLISQHVGSVVRATGINIIAIAAIPDSLGQDYLSVAQFQSLSGFFLPPSSFITPPSDLILPSSNNTDEL